MLHFDFHWCIVKWVYCDHQILKPGYLFAFEYYDRILAVMDMAKNYDKRKNTNR